MLNSLLGNALTSGLTWAIAFHAAKFSKNLANFMRKTTSALYSSNEQKRRDQNVKNSES